MSKEEMEKLEGAALAEAVSTMMDKPRFPDWQRGARREFRPDADMNDAMDVMGYCTARWPEYLWILEQNQQTHEWAAQFGRMEYRGVDLFEIGDLPLLPTAICRVALYACDVLSKRKDKI